MSGGDTIGVCTRCGAVEWDLDVVHVCPACRKAWQLMSLKDAVFFLSDALRTRAQQSWGRSLETLERISRNGGRQVRDAAGVEVAWTGTVCARVARTALEKQQPETKTES